MMSKCMSLLQTMQASGHTNTQSFTILISAVIQHESVEKGLKLIRARSLDADSYEEIMEQILATDNTPAALQVYQIMTQHRMPPSADVSNKLLTALANDDLDKTSALAQYMVNNDKQMSLTSLKSVVYALCEQKHTMQALQFVSSFHPTIPAYLILVRCLA